MGIVDRIVDGVATWDEIWEHNIEVMNEQIVKERNNKHDPDNCNIKYCSHGSKHEIKALTDHRDQLVKELQVIRAGVTPDDI